MACKFEIRSPAPSTRGRVCGKCRDGRGHDEGDGLGAVGGTLEVAHIAVAALGAAGLQAARIAGGATVALGGGHRGPRVAHVHGQSRVEVLEVLDYSPVDDSGQDDTGSTDTGSDELVPSP